MMDQLITQLITVTGKVQGVFFRESTLEKAVALHVTGSVRNLPDGKTVEIIATGTPDVIQELIAWCRTGPPHARVATISAKEQPLQIFNGFTILR